MEHEFAHRGCGCAVLAVMAIALASCGGGGSGGGPGIRTHDRGVISKPEFERLRASAAARILASPEFRSAGQWGLEAVNAHEAHATLSVVLGAGARPGDGVSVGVVDTGIDLDHPAFQDGVREGVVTENLAIAGTPNENGTGRYSHGTAVAGVVAGRPAPQGDRYTGVAPGATLTMIAVTLGSGGSGPVEPISTAQLAVGDSGDAELFRAVISQDPDVVNLSFGVEGLIENYEEADLRAALPETIEALAQAGREDRTIVVRAAGNSNGDLCHPGTPNCVGGDANNHGSFDASSPSVDAGLAALVEELRGHYVAVVAIREDGAIADFSNRCGIAADWCIAAPGQDVGAPYFGPSGGEVARGYRLLSGTSFAAPMVTGGIALMKRMFRGQLSNTDLVARLYATARKSGIYANRDVYGQGLMDLGAATEPRGETTVATGLRVGGPGHGLRTTGIRLGGAVGDGFSRSLAGREIVAFDALGAPFWFDLQGLAGAAGGPSTTSRLRDLMAPRREAAAQGGWRFGLRESPADAGSGLLGLAGEAVTLSFSAGNGLDGTAFTTAGVPGQETPETGAVLTWRPEDGPFGLRAGWLGEPESMLGSTVEGAFGRLSAESVVAGFEAGAELAGWSLAADAEIGMVSPGAGGGIVADLSGLTTSGYSLRAVRRLTADDEISLSLVQPPRVERGRATLALPVGRTRDGAVLRESVSAELVPSGRQIDLAVRWRRTGVFGGEFRAEASVSRDPGHVVDAKPALGLLAGWRAAF